MIKAIACRLCQCIEQLDSAHPQSGLDMLELRGIRDAPEMEKIDPKQLSHDARLARTKQFMATLYAEAVGEGSATITSLNI